MMQFSWVDLQQAALSALQQLSANGDRFRNKLAKRIASKGTPISANQEKLALSVIRDEHRRDPSAQAARRAVTVNLPLTGIHYTQVAFAVDDLASDRHSSQITNCLLIGGRCIHHSDGATCYFHHGSALAIDELAL